MSKSTTAVMVLAAGKGERFGSSKQFFKIKGQVILYLVIERILGFKICNHMVVIVPAETVVLVKKYFASNKQITVLAGGSNRSESTKIGLDFLIKNKYKYVFIHDGVRPFVDKSHFLSLKKMIKLEASVGALLYLPITDSVVKIGKNVIKPHMDNKRLITTQTPHLYVCDVLNKCFANPQRTDIENAQLVESSGYKISYVLGSRLNVKLTHKNDLTFFKKIIT